MQLSLASQFDAFAFPCIVILYTIVGKKQLYTYKACKSRPSCFHALWFHTYF